MSNNNHIKQKYLSLIYIILNVTYLLYKYRLIDYEI